MSKIYEIEYEIIKKEKTYIPADTAEEAIKDAKRGFRKQPFKVQNIKAKVHKK